MSENTDKLFRSAVIKQLTSPEDLDRLVRVTKPIGWLAGLALVTLIVAVVGWCFVGRLPSRVMGDGIVLPQGGRLIEVQARGSGVITRLAVGVGDHLQAGQVIARVGDTEGERNSVNLRGQIADKQRDLDTAELSASSEQRARTASLQRQTEALNLRLQNARAQEQVLAERLTTNKSLYADHLVTRAQVIQTQNELAATRQEFSNATSDLAQLGEQNLGQQRGQSDRLRDLRNSLSDLRRQLDTVNATLADQLELRSPYDGVVVEVRTQVGALIRPGQSILALTQNGTGYEVLAFVDAANGKRVHPGMQARIALASARREEFGTLMGEVTSISEFPLSYEALHAMIQNEELARSCQRSGPPFMVRLRLLPDSSSVSGYRWTSRRGGGISVSSGIPNSVEIITQLRRPISMVIPALRELLGG